MSEHKVIFTPSGVQVTSTPGRTVYDLALDAGIDIQSICGGKGLCKRCQVEFEPGEFAKFKINVTDADIPKMSRKRKPAMTVNCQIRDAWHAGQRFVVIWWSRFRQTVANKKALSRRKAQK